MVGGATKAVWSVAAKQGLCPAETGLPLTLGSFFFFTLSDEPFELTSVLLVSLTGTCLTDLVPWLVTAGAVVEAVDDNDSGCDDEDDNDDDASGGEAADAVCLDVVWTESKTER